MRKVNDIKWSSLETKRLLTWERIRLRNMNLKSEKSKIQ